MNELIVCKQCGAVLSSDYAYCDKCGGRLQYKNNRQSIKIEKDRFEKERVLLKEKEQRQKMFRWRSALYLEGCPMCGSSKAKKIKKTPVEYVQPRKWTDSFSHPWGGPYMAHLDGTQKRYIILYGCHQCGHIWYECTKYRFKRI